MKLFAIKNISSVTIVNRKDSNGWRLANLVVRAGMDELPGDSGGEKKIDINRLCIDVKKKLLY